MNYYYDLVLNFLEDNYLFYEWDEMDNIEFIKKMPLFFVSNKIFNDFYNYNVCVSDEFLKQIENKTIKKDEKLKYACLIADKNNVYAYEFNDDGKVIFRSSLTLGDELGVLEYLYTIAEVDIEYVKNEKLKYKENDRFSEKIKRFIGLEIYKLYEEKNYNKLQYLYLEWFGKRKEQIDNIYKEMQNRLSKEIGEKEIQIYNLIKISYNNV